MKFPSLTVIKEGLEHFGGIAASATKRYGETHSADDLKIMAGADSMVGRLTKAAERVARGGSEVG